MQSPIERSALGEIGPWAVPLVFAAIALAWALLGPVIDGYLCSHFTIGSTACLERSKALAIR